MSIRESTSLNESHGSPTQLCNSITMVLAIGFYLRRDSMDWVANTQYRPARSLPDSSGREWCAWLWSQSS